MLRRNGTGTERGMGDISEVGSVNRIDPRGMPKPCKWQGGGFSQIRRTWPLRRPYDPKEIHMRKLPMAAAVIAMTLVPAGARAEFLLDASIGKPCQVTSPRAWGRQGRAGAYLSF